ncbi:MAG: DUF4332 domain-containing protein [Promethearchaeota archaeon]
MSVSIERIEGIGPVYTKKLAYAGIKTSKNLLEAGRTRSSREALAKKLDIPYKLVLRWVNLADLIRIKGISKEYSDLLEEAGVDTVAELSKRSPESLHTKVLDVNKKKKLVRRSPTLDVVRRWIEHAKKLPRLIEY